jgi:hypothetical protein
MFTLLVKFSFPGEIEYHQEFFFESEKELKDFSVRVDNCSYTEVVRAAGFISKDEYLAC